MRSARVERRHRALRRCPAPGLDHQLAQLVGVEADRRPAVAADVRGDAERLRVAADQRLLVLDDAFTVAIAAPSPSYTVAKILSRTRNVGWPQVSRSCAPGRPRAS